MPEYINLLYTKFYSDFQNFIFSNNILVTASGFTIGFATNNLINNNIALFMPFLYIIRDNLIKYNNIYFGLPKDSIITSFIYYFIVFFLNILSWIITIIFTFILLEYMLNNKIFGLKSTVKESEEKNFIISKVSAKNNDIIPTNTDLKKIKVKEKTDEIIGDKIIKNKEINHIKQSENIINNQGNELFYNYMLL